MPKSKEDLVPDHHKAPAEHKEREGATDYSGFQPPSKFSNTGSTAEETPITKDQRK